MTRHLPLGLLVLLASLLAVGLVFAAPKAPDAGWTENWANTSAWHPIGSPCWTVGGGKLTMQCQSAGLVSNQKWNRTFPVSVSVVVSASAALLDRYFAGVTIYNDDGTDTNYGELALTARVPPFTGVPPMLGSLVNEYGAWHAWVAPATAHLLKVGYSPTGQYDFWMDGVKVGTRPGTLNANPAIFLLCVSVGENTPNDGSAARCEFGAVSVTGVLATAVISKSFLPVLQEQPPHGYP